MGCPESHGQGSKAAFIGAVKSAAVVQQAAVQVKADVGLETLRETLQNLQENQVQIRIRDMFHFKFKSIFVPCICLNKSTNVI